MKAQEESAQLKQELGHISPFRLPSEFAGEFCRGQEAIKLFDYTPVEFWLSSAPL